MNKMSLFYGIDDSHPLKGLKAQNRKKIKKYVIVKRIFLK